MKLFSLFSLLVTCLGLHAQQYAVTEDGRKVRLNDDKTWEYVIDSASTAESSSDTTIKGTYKKAAGAISFFKSAKTDFGVYYNPAKWEAETTFKVGDAENILKLKNQDGYCITVGEMIPVPMETLADIMKEAKSKAPNVTNVVFDQPEYRMVNNIKVLYMKFSGTTRGIDFVYVGYFVSDESGTYQLMCYTSKNLFSGYEKDFMEMLNGLVKIKAKTSN